MMVSTRGRYALRVMVDIAEHNSGKYIPLKEIAERQRISEKYLESIIVVLSKAGYLDGLRGKGGGYKLTHAPEDYTVASILKLTEGSFAPIACLEKEKNDCPHISECRTLPMWTELYKLIDDFFSSRTIADMMQTEDGGDFVI